VDNEISTAERYRNRAEEIRMISEGMQDGNTKRILVSIADDYERMARSLDAIADHNRQSEEETKKEP
jgi:hypothetical protein